MWNLLWSQEAQQKVDTTALQELHWRKPIIVEVLKNFTIFNISMVRETLWTLSVQCTRSNKAFAYVHPDALKAVFKPAFDSCLIYSPNEIV